MIEFFALGVLVAVGIAAFIVAALIWAVAKLAIKIALLPLALVGAALGLVAMVVLIPIGLVAVPLSAVGFTLACVLAVVAGICWIGLHALALL